MEFSDIVHKTVLVGIEREISQGEFEYHQFFGVVERMDDVIHIRLEDGTIGTIPPDLNSFEKAEPGIYRMKCSGEQVENPDYTSCWSIKRKEGIDE